MTNEFPVTHNESRKPEGKRRVEQRAEHVLMLQHHLLGSNWIASEHHFVVFFPPSQVIANTWPGCWDGTGTWGSVWSGSWTSSGPPESSRTSWTAGRLAHAQACCYWFCDDQTTICLWWELKKMLSFEDDVIVMLQHCLYHTTSLVTVTEKNHNHGFIWSTFN